MATQVTVVAPDVRTVKVKVTPGTLMFDVLGEACKKLHISPDKWTLKHPKKQINLNDAFRVTGLPPGAKLELVSKSKTPTAVKIALRLPEMEAKDIPSGRLMESFRSDTTLWKMLRHFETKGGPEGRTLNFTDRGIPQTSNGTQAGSGQLYYEMPVLRIMNREISSLEDFQKTLSQLGLDSGSHLIQLSFRTTDQSLDDAMHEISRFFEDEEVVEAKKEEPAPKPESVAAPESSAAFLAEPPGSSGETAPQTLQERPNEETAEKDTIPVKAADQGAADSMDVDEPAPTPRNVLNPVNIFSAPTNTTIAAASIEVPDSYYTPTIAHAQAHQQILQQSAVNKRLKSDAELEADARAEEAKVAKVKNVEVRVRFPDQTLGQWVFGPDDTGSTLYQAVRGVMANESAPFKLVLPGPPTASSHIKDDAGVKHQLIKGYRLTGRVLVNLVWEDNVSQDVKKQAFLKGVYVKQAKSVEVPDVSVVEDEVEPSALLQSLAPKPQNSGESSGSAKKMPKWLKGLGGKK